MNLKTKKDIQSAFAQLSSNQTPEQKVEGKASALALTFLAEIDKAMAAKKMNKKELALAVDTSASYITQLFRGDRKPNWTMLVKMSEALSLDFHITTKDDFYASMYSPKGDNNGMWVYKNFDKQKQDFTTSAFDDSINPIAV
ncbi:helix-turn-helix domain-containing protein [Roseivirga seohaensis]|uniref:helix-turn-helix domain-containing protein n=1 Tax=Roseivirga seohaensis TaxID=1914963 RepID=UPI00069D8DA0|nr:helix-turn-helix transcriptional regulator [Roseivirga seohaensis]